MKAKVKMLMSTQVSLERPQGRIVAGADGWGYWTSLEERS
jgi:hypothetical protein